MKKLLGIIAISAVFSIVLMGCKGSEEGDTTAPPSTTGGKMEGNTPGTSTPADKPADTSATGNENKMGGDKPTDTPPNGDSAPAPGGENKMGGEAPKTTG